MMFNNILSLIDEEVIQVGDLEDLVKNFKKTLNKLLKCGDSHLMKLNLIKYRKGIDM